MAQNPQRAGQAGRQDARDDVDDKFIEARARAPQAKPAGRVLPFRLRRQPKEGKKPPCPWCGSCCSSVYRSKGIVSSDRYRRRRQCGDCGRDWPTVECLDVELFERELAARGLTLAGAGLEAENPPEGRRRADGDRTGKP